jgi:hypothetical protein
MMDFNAQLDKLEQNVIETKSAAEAAAKESHDKVKQRIDRAQADMTQAVQHAQRDANSAADSARSKWARMKADNADKMDDLKAKIEKRSAQVDAKGAAADADWAESDAGSAIDFAAWAIDNARLSVLNAIDARVYAEERAEAARR